MDRDEAKSRNYDERFHNIHERVAGLERGHNEQHRKLERLEHQFEVLRRLFVEIVQQNPVSTGVRDLLATIVCKLDQIAAALSGNRNGHSVIHVVEVGPQTKEPQVSPGAVDLSPDFKFASSRNYGILAVIGPLMQNGEYSAGGGWSTSDEATIGVPNPAGLPDEFQTQADPNWVDPGDGTFPPQVPLLDDKQRQIPIYKCKILTPLDPDPGAEVFAVVTRKATGMADVQIKCIYSNPDVGHSVITASEFPEE